MKIFLLTTLLSLGLCASQATLTYYKLGSYESGYEREIGKEDAHILIKSAYTDTKVAEVISNLKRPILSEDGKANHPDYIKMLDILKESKEIYAKWIGLNLYVNIRNKYPQKEYIKKYGLHFANVLISKNYCSAYLFKGDFIGKTGATLKQQSEIWQRGIQSECKGTNFEKFYLVSRKNGAL